ncbi:MAG: hypothetical protein NTV80_07590, partial [Verrucomicrobia bacterium]|nr:hypothetical protein [Verrucomicrobiota bacterium]
MTFIPPAMRPTQLAEGTSRLRLGCSLLGCAFFMGASVVKSAEVVKPTLPMKADSPSLAPAGGTKADAKPQGPPVARADLTFPKIVTKLPADLQIQVGAEKVAETLAHYSTALQLEKSGQMREALTHFLAVQDVDPTHPELAAHTAELLYHY